jgi:uncharacterized SAM-binding protein YcdF (DUF218 family)
MLRLLKVALACCTLLGILVLAVSFTPMVQWMARDQALEWFDGDADVLVVLGGSMLVDGAGPRAAMGYDSYLRCTYASWMIQRHRYAYVIVSGPDGLADAMASFLINRNAKTIPVLRENAAKSTSENAEFVRKILDHQPGLPSRPLIAILTSDYHCRRAQQVFQHWGMPVHVIPVPDAAKSADFPLQRWTTCLTLCDERVKYAFYKLNGRI